MKQGKYTEEQISQHPEGSRCGGEDRRTVPQIRVQ